MPWSKELSLSLHDFGLDGQLLAREPERFLRERLGDAGELEHHAPGLDDADPALGRALAGAHAGLGRLLREALVREDVDPDLAATLDLARHRDPGRLDLAVRDPAGVESLEAVVPVLDDRLAGGGATATAAMDLAELRLLRHQHQASPSLGSASAFGSAFLRGARFGFSAAGSAGAGAAASGAGVSAAAGVSTTSGACTCSSGFGCSTRWSRRGRPPPPPAPRRWPGLPGPPPPGPRRRWRTGPRPSRSWPRDRPLSREAPRPSSAPPRRRRVSWSPRRVSVSPKPSGMISPLLIQTLTPIRPAEVFASTKP